MVNKKGRSNKVKFSRYRKQVDEMLSDGVPPIVIAKWLKGQDPPENISKTTIYEYKNFCFDIEGKAVQQYFDKKSEEQLERAVSRRVSEVEKLQCFADEALDLKLDTDIPVDEKTTRLDIEKHKLNIIKTGIYAQRVVNDFLRGVEPEKDVNINLGLTVHDRIKKRAEYYKQLDRTSKGID